VCGDVTTQPATVIVKDRYENSQIFILYIQVHYVDSGLLAQLLKTILFVDAICHCGVEHILGQPWVTDFDWLILFA